MSPTARWKMFVTLCSLLLGVLLVFQLKAQAKAPDSLGPENILPVLVDKQQENSQIQAENDRLNSELQKLKAADSAAQLASEQLTRAKLLAGVVDVKGPGIVITLDDSHREEMDPDLIEMYIIHEQYLREFVNLLWNAKAEAISINNERITAKTEILCGGNVIFINGTAQTPPFVIKAIGDPTTLQQGQKFINFQTNLEQLGKDYGIGFRVETAKELIIKGKYWEPRLANPVKEGQ